MIRKTLSTLTLGLVFASSAFANNKFQESFRMLCVTEFPTTSIIAEKVGTELVVQVIHHHGMKFMPLHSGIITPNDLSTLAKKADDFGKIGDRYEFRWDMKKCERTDNELFSCHGGKDTVIEGTPVNPFSIYTQRVTSESDAGKFEKLHVGFLISIDKESHSFSMGYEKYECAFE